MYHVPGLCTDDNTSHCDVKIALWLEELNLQQDHPDMILFGRALNGDIINAWNPLSSQFPEVNGLHSTFHTSLVWQEYKFTTLASITGSLAIQLVVQRSVELGFLIAGELSTETEVQLAQIHEAGGKDMLRVEVCPVQQQEGEVDCGVTFTTDLCHGADPVAVSYCHEKMRAHLLTCLRWGSSVHFQGLRKLGAWMQGWWKPYCSCKLPEGFDTNIVACELCLQWYHYKWVGISDIHDTNKSWCNPCVQN